MFTPRFLTPIHNCYFIGSVRNPPVFFLNIISRNWILLAFSLSYFHFMPAYISVNIIYKKSNETYHYGNIFNITYTCKYPQNNQHYIVRRISQCKIGASSESKIYGNKARCNRNGTWHYICCIEIIQHKEENYCNYCSNNTQK